MFHFKSCVASLYESFNNEMPFKENGAKVEEHVFNQLTEDELQVRLNKLRLQGIVQPTAFMYKTRSEDVTTSPAL